MGSGHRKVGTGLVENSPTELKANRSCSTGGNAMKNNHVLIAKYPAPNATKWRDDAAARIDEAIKAARYDFYLQPERCAAFDSLIGTVRSRTLLLRPTSS